MAKGKLVIQDADGIWLASRLAVERSGLAKAELERRAFAGELRFKPDIRDRPQFYFEPEISALAKAFVQPKNSPPSRVKRQPTAKQLEARYARQAKELAATSRQGRGGPVSAHYSRVMIADIFAKKPKPTDS